MVVNRTGFCCRIDAIVRHPGQLTAIIQPSVLLVDEYNRRSTEPCLGSHQLVFAVDGSHLNFLRARSQFWRDIDGCFARV